MSNWENIRLESSFFLVIMHSRIRPLGICETRNYFLSIFSSIEDGVSAFGPSDRFCSSFYSILLWTENAYDSAASSS